MKVGIMQPYFCPYIGYFQLINAVDKFIIYDDVQYKKDGWINRNKILVKKKEPHMFTLSVKSDSHTLNINERRYVENIDQEKKNLRKTIKYSYARAPNYEQVQGLIEDILSIDELNVAKMNTKSLKIICDYLNINTPFLISSKLDKNDKLEGQARVINITKGVGADHYLNPIGGTELYSKDDFKKEGLKLSFLKTKEIKYKQFNNEFVPNLSIIDVLMFNSKEGIKKMLNKYELI